MFDLAGCSFWLEHLAQTHGLYWVMKLLFLFWIAFGGNVFKLDFVDGRICAYIMVTEVSSRDLGLRIILGFVYEAV